jgi:hypothetical protein
MYFATCERKRALGFLKKIYPSRDVLDVEDNAKDLLDLIGADIVRITDPDFHTPEIIQGTKYRESDKDRVLEVCKKFHEGD